MAGLEVLVRSGAEPSAAFPGYYDRYPSAGGSPHLILELAQSAGFSEESPVDPDWPAFRRRRVDDRTMEVSRRDAQGVFVFPDGPGDPVRGSFRTGGAPHTLEAIIRLGASVTLPRRGGLILHASCIAWEGRAHVFAGQSGAGKSTLSTLLAESVPKTIKIADELLIVAPDAAGRWRAFVPPFVGGPELPHGESWPCEGLYFLEQAPIHGKERVAPADALRELLRHVLVYVVERETATHVLDTASRLAHAVPCFRLQFAKDPAVAEVLGIT